MGSGAQASDTVSPIIIEIARCFISCQTGKMDLFLVIYQCQRFGDFILLIFNLLGGCKYKVYC